MAFLSIPSAWIQVGQAVKKKLFQRIADNLDDHESRLNNVEGGLIKSQVFNFPVYGFINNYQNEELIGIDVFKASNTFILTEFRVTLVQNAGAGAVGWYASSSQFGTLEMDLQKSVDGGFSWQTVLLTRPTIGTAPGSVLGDNVANGTYALADIDPLGQDVAINDMLRLVVISKKQRQGAFHIHVYGELS